MDLLRILLGDPEIDLWFLDEAGIKRDTRPKSRWALKGEGIRQPYLGAHIRISATGTVCPRTGEFYALIFRHSSIWNFSGSRELLHLLLTPEEHPHFGQCKLASLWQDKLGPIRTGLSSSLFSGSQSYRTVVASDEIWMVLRLLRRNRRSVDRCYLPRP